MATHPPSGPPCDHVDPVTGKKCGKTSTAKGKCLRHYQAFRRFQLNQGRDPTKPKDNTGPMTQVATKVNDATLEAIMATVMARDSTPFEIIRDVLATWATKKSKGELGNEWP